MGEPFHFSPRPNRAGEIGWRQWGQEAFQEAQQAGKPVLLAISAVWCHWCHVMDETSYSDGDVIRLVNDRFVPVRVDNDQRPDVNRRYNMGGWPTTAFLTPDGEIIHGGTYIPPDQMRGLLGQVADLWRDKRDEISARIAESRSKEESSGPEGATPPGAPLTEEILQNTASIIRGQYDPQFGGFGRAPKFPQPRVVRFLLDEYRRHGYPDVATMLHKTLGAMASRGMYDHVAGGFFRYSTTREWEIPHFEKMLEDNAELLHIYAEAHRTFPDAGYDRVVRDVIRWMDATLWRDDVKAFSGSQDADEHYYELDAAERAKHAAPYVDRTVYTSWNALAASAYLAAFTALGDVSFEKRAHEVVVTLANSLTVDGALMHFDAGHGPQLPDLLADLASLVTAMLDTYETGEHPSALLGAELGAARMRERLEDDAHGGFYDAPEREEQARVARREKPIEDNAVAAEALLRLASLSGDEKWRETALRTLRAFAGQYRQWGQFAASYAAAVARALVEPLTISVVGPADDPVATALWETASRSDDPARAIQRLLPDDSRLPALGYPADRVAAYVCVGTACSEPITDVATLRAELAKAHSRFEALA